LSTYRIVTDPGLGYLVEWALNTVNTQLGV
jgi:hypothetical protein